MKAEIVSIGDELLIGQTINTNASFIAEKLTDLGIEVTYISTIGDSERKIIEALHAAEHRSQVAIFTGGLGPTHDDVTKNAFARYFSSSLILDEEILQSLRQRFQKRKIKMAQVNEQQAKIPDNATVIHNTMGTAPGLLFDKNNKFFFVLPGVPVEMKTMMLDFVLPFLKQRNDNIIKRRVLHFSGIPESTLFERIGEVEKLEQLAKIAFLPSFGMIDVRLTACGSDEADLTKRIETVENEIRNKAASFIWGTDEERIEDIIVNQLITSNKTLAIVELGSKGKIIGQLIANCNPVPLHVQGYVLPSVVAFNKLFAIDDTYCPLSHFADETTAKYLADNLRKQIQSDFALATIFFPSDNDTTFIALSDPTGTRVWQHTFLFEGEMAIERLSMAVKHHLFHYLKQKLLD